MKMMRKDLEGPVSKTNKVLRKLRYRSTETSFAVFLCVDRGSDIGRR
jgi:hypothetical protein